MVIFGHLGPKTGIFWDFWDFWGQKQGFLGFLVGGQKFEFLAIYSPVGGGLMGEDFRQVWGGGDFFGQGSGSRGSRGIQRESRGIKKSETTTLVYNIFQQLCSGRGRPGDRDFWVMPLDP